ncbi:hypothetical protein GGP41_001916 [Bipolaris sorokiniana]|uniref:Uncharacterized protein n=1 Tax=Cochliobolus sativus TaxID=45130 RepID=A0A8H6DZH1_COCSA|nr:hypothetical protein GGP41_001916 [Bipolaris sorokiniana]
MKLLATLTLTLLPTLALAGEGLPPRPSGKYGKNVPPEPVDTPLKHPKDPALWWQGITDDDVYYPEWAISARADANAETTVVDANTNDDANANVTAIPDINLASHGKKKKKKEKKKKGMGLAGRWRYRNGHWINYDKGGKKERWGGAGRLIAQMKKREEENHCECLEGKV